MSKIRKPAVAGSFYPSNKADLNKIIDDFLEKTINIHSKPKAIIVPHAGYIYSGSVAASAYKPLMKLKNKIKKIILFGPSHRVSFEGLALPADDIFKTPLGEINIDQENINLIKNLPQISFSNKAHELEHSLEVQLPFLQKIFGDNFNLTPIVVGISNPQEISQIIEKLWGGEETLIVISTDLSHYNTYEEAYKIDATSCKQIEKLEIEQLNSRKLCGFLPVSGLLNFARKKDLKVKLVDFCNSGDTAGDQNRVVGYASFYCGKEKDLGNFFSKPHKEELLSIAYETIKYALQNNLNPPDYIESILDFDTYTKVATFVTLKINCKLRGCIGALEARRDILQDVAYNAYCAAFKDPRFPPVNEDELKKLEIEISILTQPEPLEFSSKEDLLKKIRPNIDGLILTYNQKRGTFLPSVWQDVPKKEDFLHHLLQKAGLKADFWSNNIKIERYETIKFE